MARVVRVYSAFAYSCPAASIERVLFQVSKRCCVLMIVLLLISESSKPSRTKQRLMLEVWQLTVDGVQFGRGKMSVQSMGKTTKYFCPNFHHLFLGNVHRKSCNVESWKLIPVFHNPHRKFLSLSFGGGSNLGVPCKGALFGRVEQEGGKPCSDLHPKDP